MCRMACLRVPCLSHRKTLTKTSNLDVEVDTGSGADVNAALSVFHPGKLKMATKTCKSTVFIQL